MASGEIAQCHFLYTFDILGALNKWKIKYKTENKRGHLCKCCALKKLRKAALSLDVHRDQSKLVYLSASSCIWYLKPSLFYGPGFKEAIM